MNTQFDPPAVLRFGRFTILPQRGELLADGVAVELGGRAFDVLVALVEARGTILSKEDLMTRVWPGRIVEENNLQVQIAALRKVLSGERELIRTIAGRGYQFTGVVLTGEEPGAGPATPSAVSTNLPEAVSVLIGRDADVQEIIALLAERRLVTLTGAGGIGKTRLGLEAARQMLAKFPDGVWIAELGALTDPKLVPVAVAAGLGLTFASGVLSSERVAAALGAKRLMIVLDNCEHVINAAASMAEAVLRASEFACVLVTSREPLRAEGESIFRVPSLDVPAEEAVDRQLLLKSGAVRLFLARTRATEGQLSIARIAAIGAICRRLDGIPLAIELAAARAAAIGIEGLAARLDDRFRLLTGGHRTALPRHQTLRATVDWSYEMLPATERVILRRLSVFSGSFTLEAAGAVVSGGDIAAPDVVDYVANLVAKSLVTADVKSANALYRLLNTMRAYALEKLAESGELDEFGRRHAEHYRNILEQASVEWGKQATGDWLATYSRQIDNLRAALDWAFSPAGDAEVGAALTAAGLPLWFQLSLIDECRRRVEQALAAVRPTAGAGTRRDMQLFAALATGLLYTKGPGTEVDAAWSRALETAQSLNDVDYQLRALWGLWASCVTGGKLRLALKYAQSFVKLAATKTDRTDSLVGDRMVGLSSYHLGDQAEARKHLERMLSRYVSAAHQADLIRFQFDQRVMARMTLGQVLWLQGYPDQAMLMVQAATADAEALDHAASICNSLSHAGCRVALLSGDLATADHCVGLLLHHSQRHDLPLWHIWGRCFQAVLQIKRGDVAAGVRDLQVALDELHETGLVLPRTVFLGDLAEGLARIGQPARGLAAIDEALERSAHSEEHWCAAELLRIKGELLLAANAPGEAQACFERSLDRSRKQADLSWQLRAATSLARLWKESGRTSDAKELLADAYGRFTEGFDTADLKSAKLLLDSLG